MTLCIATIYASAPSETFIAGHIRNLAPGATILLCEFPQGGEEYGCPVLSPIDVWCPPRTFAERVVNGVRHRRRTYFRAGMGAQNAARVISYLEQHRVDVVLAEYGPIGCRMAYVCRKLRIRLFVHFHGFDASLSLRDQHQIRQYRLLFRLVAGVITPSQFLADALVEIGCPKGKLHVLPYGVDTRAFAPGRNLKRQLLLAVGRLVEKKAPHLSIQAFARIAHSHPEVRLDLVGDGPLAEQCRILITNLGIGERVRLLGIRGREFVAGLMRDASVFVQHSVTASDGDMEGLPVAILEAMASGLPVISTRHSGIPEAVIDGVTGLLVAENDVHGMAQAMGDLLDDPARAATMGAVGRERVLACFTQEMAHNRLRAILGLPAPANVHAAA